MTYPTFPLGVDIASAEWGLLSNSMSHISPLSGAEDTLELPGARWFVTLTPDADLTRAEAAALEAFLIALRGRAGRFYLWNHARPSIRGSGAGAPVVGAANQLGASMATAGWTPNAVGVLLPGDYVGIGGELKMVTAQVDANASGVATLPIEPPQRYAPAAGSAVVLTRPTAVFRLLEDRQAFRHAGAGSSVTIQAIETF